MGMRLIGSIALIALFACRREPIVFSVVPQIEYVGTTPKVVQEFGAVTITIRYRDGDGDLGGQPDGVPDLFLKDLRDSTRFPPGYDGILRYNMPRFLEKGPQSIQGTIEITVPGLARLDPNAASEYVAFEIHIIDRAGNQSNKVRTDLIQIVP
ncbi:MAG: hypothetical protein N2253_08105 [Bacteroidia bacterium]|nr:hypothetical protein [Bacteroidia bacterium]MCX7764837.1 hypothetical protein [Bacteroidia bacterium]MDW8057917.1 hypothetical protein [Bacteroidia bacterium]